jgi:hypothetical protein
MIQYGTADEVATAGPVARFVTAARNMRDFAAGEFTACRDRRVQCFRRAARFGNRQNAWS